MLFEIAADDAATPARTNARYEGDWYFCWLIERRDTPEPQWWTTGCTWTKTAHEALWYSRKSDADADAGECPHDVVVCEHGFMIDKTA